MGCEATKIVALVEPLRGAADMSSAIWTLEGAEQVLRPAVELAAVE